MRTKLYSQNLWESFYLSHVLFNGFAEKEPRFLPISDGCPPSPALLFLRIPQAISLSMHPWGPTFGSTKHSTGWWNAPWSRPIQTQGASNARVDDISAWGGRSTQDSGWLCNMAREGGDMYMRKKSIRGVGSVFMGKPENKTGELGSVLHVMSYQQRWSKMPVGEKYLSYSSFHWHEEKV